MKRFWLLPLLLGACTYAGSPTPSSVPARTPVAPTRPSLLAPGEPVPLALHWTRSSAEHRAILLQSYHGAEARLRELAAPLSRGSWAVIMDADETVLDNSLYFQRQAARGYLGFTYNWPSFIHEAIAPALPGAVSFTSLIHELGGRLVIVTNRAASLCPDTRRNLENAGIKSDAVLCQPPGNDDKNPRFLAVQHGGVEGLPPLHVAMWVGDNIQDFPGLTQAQMRNAPDTAFSEFGRSWWILPNPIYGSWQNNPLPDRP
ncbi:MAG: HAD family acid phosphatase [Gemmatimonadaceae bacterium]